MLCSLKLATLKIIDTYDLALIRKMSNTCVSLKWFTALALRKFYRNHPQALLNSVITGERVLKFDVQTAWKIFHWNSLSFSDRATHKLPKSFVFIWSKLLFLSLYFCLSLVYMHSRSHRNNYQLKAHARLEENPWRINLEWFRAKNVSSNYAHDRRDGKFSNASFRWASEGIRKFLWGLCLVMQLQVCQLKLYLILMHFFICESTMMIA